MKITALKTFLVPPRWLFLKIETDEGLCGWGEPVLEGRAQTVAAAIAELADYLIGKDPSPIEDHWSVLYRGGFYRGGAVLMSAIAGIDQALWDLKGKLLGQPVHRLMGGPVREKIRAYSWISGDSPEALAASARKAAENEFTALKMLATGEIGFIDSFAKIDAAVGNVAAVREAVGGEFGIGVDFHGRVHRPMVKTLVKELEPLRLMFVEEPVLAEHLDVLRDVRAQFSVPIALGERLYSRWDFRDVFELGLVDIIQPDVSHAGGISETRKIAAVAECYDIALAPHCPLGPIALAASLQVDAVCANAAIQEQSIGMHYHDGTELLDYVKDARVFAFEQGHLRIPTGPGLGVEINEEFVLEQAKTGHRWRSPMWRHEDGSVAEW